MSNSIVGQKTLSYQSVLNEYGSPQALNAAALRGEPIPVYESEGPFSDEYIIRSQRFEDGQQEVVAFSVAVQRRFHELRLRPRGMRGKREKLESETDDDVSEKAAKSLKTSIERSRRMIRKRCKSIRADRMLTLTMRRNEASIEVWAKAWDEFRRRLNRLQDFHYVAVPERHERGGWHMHVAVSGRQNWKLLRSIWLSVISKLGTDGAVNDSSGNRKLQALMRKIGGKGRAMRHRIATYIAKYVGKDSDVSTFNKKRYWTSRGIVVPEVTTYAHLGPEYQARDAVVAAHRCVLGNGATCDGAQFYWNQGIGVFWMATGNTG
ncbi:hypothetical protein FAZ69_23345 [Trinickia terrae]|uniref:Replication-associated protein ORF2/G2P domain-containing protein n=1 Tax=Trinickia terrae TaxID=2571161 RepID=A0A4V5PL81_9BURK|nr:hypothetical protein [Trinickia terrae]TKC83430.1 hypothetical protein FAZ69_23345 [Trinickia terrae]